MPVGRGKEPRGFLAVVGLGAGLGMSLTKKHSHFPPVPPGGPTEGPCLGRAVCRQLRGPRGVGGFLGSGGELAGLAGEEAKMSILEATLEAGE